MCRARARGGGRGGGGGEGCVARGIDACRASRKEGEGAGLGGRAVSVDEFDNHTGLASRHLVTPRGTTYAHERSKPHPPHLSRRASNKSGREQSTTNSRATAHFPHHPAIAMAQQPKINRLQNTHLIRQVSKQVKSPHPHPHHPHDSSTSASRCRARAASTTAATAASPSVG